jgi:hypothetical protein
MNDSTKRSISELTTKEGTKVHYQTVKYQFMYLSEGIEVKKIKAFVRDPHLK